MIMRCRSVECKLIENMEPKYETCKYCEWFVSYPDKKKETVGRFFFLHDLEECGGME